MSPGNIPRIHFRTLGFPQGRLCRAEMLRVLLVPLLLVVVSLSLFLNHFFFLLKEGVSKKWARLKHTYSNEWVGPMGG